MPLAATDSDMTFLNLKELQVEPPTPSRSIVTVLPDNYDSDARAISGWHSLSITHAKPETKVSTSSHGITSCGAAVPLRLPAADAPTSNVVAATAVAPESTGSTAAAALSAAGLGEATRGLPGSPASSPLRTSNLPGKTSATPLSALSPACATRREGGVAGVRRDSGSDPRTAVKRKSSSRSPERTVVRVAGFRSTASTDARDRALLGASSAAALEPDVEPPEKGDALRERSPELLLASSSAALEYSAR